MAADTPILPAHIDETVQAIAKLHAEHHRQSTPLQRIVDRMTALVGRPGFVGLLTAVVLVWMAANLMMAWAGREPVDPPPFAWLQGMVGLMALYTFIMQELRAANMTGDAARTAACRVDLVEPLADGWRQAALENLTGGTGPRAK